MKKLLLLVCMCAGLLYAGQLDDDKKFYDMQKKYSKAKGDEKFMREAFLSGKPKGDFFSSELKAKFKSDDEWLNLPFCDWARDPDLLVISGALLMCGPRMGTENYAFECKDGTCQVIDTALVASGHVSENWRK